MTGTSTADTAEEPPLRDSPVRGRSYLPPDAVPAGRTLQLLLCVLVTGLVVDRLIPIWGQIIAGVMTWTLFLKIAGSMPAAGRRLLMSCLVVATLGEIFCSLVWQLYDYRLLSIPFYVPPGHVIVFLLGSALAPRMPKSIVRTVPLLIGSYVALSFLLGFDRFGIVLFLFFIAMLAAEQDRRLYATMFLLCLLLEVVGTLLGNWTWKTTVPLWGLSTTNPPVVAGTFYCLLDFLMLRVLLSYDYSREVLVKVASGIRSRGADFVRTFPRYGEAALVSAEQDANEVRYDGAGRDSE